MPKISVIIPIYNSEVFLQEAIESVLAQSFSDFEAILVDDGSTDSSGEICDKIAKKDPRFKVIHQVNGGLSAARNSGIKFAKGEYIYFLDADDTIKPDTFSILVDCSEKNKVNIAMAKMYRKFKKKNKEINTINLPQSHILSSSELIENILYQQKASNSMCGVLIKRSLLDNLFFRERCWFEDLDIFYRIYERTSQIVFVDVPLYFYRMNPDSFISKWSDGKLDVLDVTDRIEEYYKNTPICKAAKDRKLSANFNILIQIYKYKIENRAVENRCWENIKRLRLTSLKNKKVRLKNKLGIIASFGGKKIVKLLAKFY